MGREDAEIKPRTKRSMTTNKITIALESSLGIKSVYIKTTGNIGIQFKLTVRRDRAALQRLVNIINTALGEDT